ncbi:hypothetical protein EW145_g7490 [Phellinidium pouzarii]|uniref:Acyltransferase MbtK/IucB-like conserved domain-containing protein n=1 Tax=Phellinidium pouzarii TaxID=167371 RepID=A0A4S4KMX9_9AGAM|nr:hypothetical protein EW145_g7490 [Phellinidium pouzarii]
MDKANQRLKQIQNIVEKQKHVLILPDNAHVVLHGPDALHGATTITIDARRVLKFRSLPREAALVLSALGTPFEKNNPVPKYSVLELFACEGIKTPITIPDLWAVVYTLWTLLHTQEVMPFVFAPSIPPNDAETLSSYLLNSGLARHALDPNVPELFLLRGTFWQGAGSGPAWGVTSGWLRRPIDYAAFPPRWGEQGDMEKHRAYVAGIERDPHMLPLIMSWDDERMGYAEIVWIKENHVAAYVPGGAQDHDRGLHVLVGEEKFRGQIFSQSWFRSVTHFMFLADPRTARIIGEPKRNNPAIIKTSVDAGMHIKTAFYFPYKYSVMTCNLRERFFKEDMLQ